MGQEDPCLLGYVKFTYSSSNLYVWYQLGAELDDRAQAGEWLVTRDRMLVCKGRHIQEGILRLGKA